MGLAVSELDVHEKQLNHSSLKVRRKFLRSRLISAPAIAADHTIEARTGCHGWIGRTGRMWLYQGGLEKYKEGNSLKPAIRTKHRLVEFTVLWFDPATCVISKVRRAHRPVRLIKQHPAVSMIEVPFRCAGATLRNVFPEPGRENERSISEPPGAIRVVERGVAPGGRTNACRGPLHTRSKRGGL